MKKWATTFRAINPLTGDLTTWNGPAIEGLTKGMAQQWCTENAGHLVVDGELIAEIPCNADGTPEWDNRIDYDVDGN